MVLLKSHKICGSRNRTSHWLFVEGLLSAANNSNSTPMSVFRMPNNNIRERFVNRLTEIGVVSTIDQIFWKLITKIRVQLPSNQNSIDTAMESVFDTRDKYHACLQNLSKFYLQVFSVSQWPLRLKPRSHCPVSWLQVRSGSEITAAIQFNSTGASRSEHFGF